MMRESAPAELPGILPPALTLWAGEDGVLERYVAEAGLAPCDNGRLVVGGAGHWLLVERPERVGAEFLGALGAAPGTGR